MQILHKKIEFSQTLQIWYLLDGANFTITHPQFDGTNAMNIQGIIFSNEKILLRFVHVGEPFSLGHM